jgi:hypothetical protein
VEDLNTGPTHLPRERLGEGAVSVIAIEGDIARLGSE